jgi:hypothetical protein
MIRKTMGIVAVDFLAAQRVDVIVAATTSARLVTRLWAKLLKEAVPGLTRVER